MSELQIFENSEFGSVRTVDVDGKIYFLLMTWQRLWGTVFQKTQLQGIARGR